MTALMLLLAAAEEAEGGLGGPFALEPGLMFWTWVVFLVLLFALRKYAWPPIVRLTEERERKIAEQLADAERLNHEAQAALEEHRALVAGAREEAHGLINEAKALAEQERQNLIARAHEEQERILERARRESPNRSAGPRDTEVSPCRLHLFPSREPGHSLKPIPSGPGPGLSLPSPDQGQDESQDGEAGR